MLRFDPSGAVHPDHGVTTEQMRELHPRLERIRKRLTNPEPDSATDASGEFYRLPLAQADAYKKLRETSELGRIFKVANSQMDLLDAVVILGAGGSHLGPRALIDANCDPYHNELRRGPRGGKPRVYFAGHDLDNDSLQALLSRINAGGYADNDLEDRWGIVVIDKDGQCEATMTALEYLLAALKKNLRHADQSLLHRFVVPITGSKGKLRDRAVSLGCEEIFDFPDHLCDAYSIHSSVGMLPAAMLGLDIMKLLEGAVAMNEHFESAAPKDNIVFQFAAINQINGTTHDSPLRIFHYWDRSLETVCRWYENLIRCSLPSATMIKSGYQHGGNKEFDSRPQTGSVLHNLMVQQCRTDPLEMQDTGETSPASGTFGDRLSDRMRQTNRELNAAGQRTTDIQLPTIDTYILGQFFQFLMLATHIETELLRDMPNTPTTSIATISVQSN